MFGQQTSSFGFGAPSSAPAFGAPSTGFGAAAAPFGQQAAAPSPFGATSTPGAFGAQPAFGGAASAPAFGAPAASGGMFGGSFGGAAAKPAGFAFGGSTPSPFGAPSQPAFGAAASTPAFGAAPAATPSFGGFGAPATSAPAFGAAGAFGAASTPAAGFGATSTAFGGSTGFGAASAPAFGAVSSQPFGAASTPAFGGFGASSSPAFGAGGFGAAAPAAASPAAAQANAGSRTAAWTKTSDRDSSGGAAGTATTVYYMDITAMQQYQAKSQEELRAEDYAAGVKAAGQAPAPAAGFGAAAAPASTGFGGFGAASPSTGFGASSGPSLFGASSSPSLFGGQPAASSPFGSTGFGAASTPAFGAAATPAFGAAPASAPAFGGFGAPATSTPAFGATPAPAFGSSFGAASSAAPFSLGSSPAFGATSTSAPAFGASFGASAGGSLFGASNTPAFGASPAASSPFGGGLFSTPAAGSSPSLFGAASTPATSLGAFGGFGAKPATPAPSFGGFGAASSAAFSFGGAVAPSTGGGLFGTPAAAPSSSPFGGTSLFGTAPAGGGSIFGAPAAGQLGAGWPGAAPAGGTPPGVGQSPYGTLQPLPTVNLETPKVGIAARPVRSQVSSLRPSPLLTMRGSTPKFGLGLGGRGPGSASPLTPAAPSPMSMASPTGDQNGSPASVLLPPRDNPHQLFIKQAPPSTAPASSSSLTPSRPSPAGGTPAAASSRAAGGGGGLFSPATPPGPQSAAAAAAAGASRGSAGDARGSAGRGREDGAGEAAGGSSYAFAGSKQGPTPASNGSAAAANGASHGSQGPASNMAGSLEAADGRGGISPSVDIPHLGALAEQGYSMTPSERELKVLVAEEGPAALTSLPSLTITHQRWGSVSWPGPLDVSSVGDLSQVVALAEGEVSVYAGAGDKPPVGHGLNRQARVALRGVYKKDKQGGLVSDPAVLARYEKRLRRYCAEMGARFISYDRTGGVWVFEVDHFSRYAAPLDDDDDDMEDADDLGAPPPLQQLKERPLQQLGGEAAPGEGSRGGAEVTLAEGLGSEGDMEMEVGAGATSAAPGGQTEEEVVGGDGGGGASTWAGWTTAVAEGPPLQHSLPALLGHSPQDLKRMRQDFFGRGGVSEAAAALTSPPGSLFSSTPAAHQQQQQHAAAGFERQAAPAAADHNWVPRPTGLRGPPAPTSTSSSGAPQGKLLAVSTAGKRRRGERAPSIRELVLAGFNAAQQGAVEVAAPTPGLSAALQAATAVGGATRCCVDASLLLGRSFRVGWGPGGTWVTPSGWQSPTGVPGSGVSGPSLGQVQLQQLDPAATCVGSTAAAAGGGVASVRSLQLDSVLGGLGALWSRSIAVMGGPQSQRAPGTGQGQEEDGEGSSTVLPWWKFELKGTELPGLVADQLAALAGDGSEVGDSSTTTSPAAGPAAAQLQHLQETWQLVQVLWEELPEAEGQGEQGLMEAGSPLGAADCRLVDLKRRAALSHWLTAVVKPEVEAALQQLLAAGPAAGGGGARAAGAQQQQAAGGSLLWAVLQLLAGHQVAAATALAAAAGDVRLSTLLAGWCGCRSSSKDLRDQLQVWSEVRLLPAHLSRARQLIYSLLAASAAGGGGGGGDGATGQPAVVPVVQALQLSWRRTLGCWLWYMRPVGSNPAGVVAAYTDALSQSEAPLPRPLPHYHHTGEQQQQPQEVEVTDVQYGLLRLAASKGRLVEAAEDVAVLLRAAGYSPHPLDVAPGWLLGATLGGLGLLPASTTTGVQLTGTMLLLLQLLGAPVAWQAFLVLAGPPLAPAAGTSSLSSSSTLGPQDMRLTALRELLHHSAASWSGEEAAAEGLLQQLQVPPGLMAMSQALWHRSGRRLIAAYHQLLAAGAAPEAHQLLLQHIAPPLFLAADWCSSRRGSIAAAAAGSRLQQLMVLLEPLADQAGGLGSAWELGGDLYLSFGWLLGAVSAACAAADGNLVAAEQQQQQQTWVPAPLAEAGSVEELRERVQQLQQRVELAAGPSGAEAGAATGSGLWSQTKQRCVLQRMQVALQHMQVQLAAGCQ